MKNLKNNKQFIAWAENLYDENCLERHSHGQKQHASFEVYYKLYKDWLWTEYQTRVENVAS